MLFQPNIEKGTKNAIAPAIRARTVSCHGTKVWRPSLGRGFVYASPAVSKKMIHILKLLSCLITLHDEFQSKENRERQLTLTSKFYQHGNLFESWTKSNFSCSDSCSFRCHQRRRKINRNLVAVNILCEKTPNPYSI